MKKLKIAMVALCLAATACGGGEETGDSESTSGSEAAVSYEGPIGSSDTAAGEQVYNDYCAGCHQGGDGGADAAPAVNGIGWTAEHMRRQVREGEDSMPAFSESTLSGEQLEQLLAYLASTGGVTP